MNMLVHFGIYGHSWSCQIALAYGSCNFENFQNITRGHKSRNTLTFIWFPFNYCPDGKSIFGSNSSHVLCLFAVRNTDTKRWNQFTRSQEIDSSF